MRRKAITDKMKMEVLRDAEVTVRCEGPCREKYPLSLIQFDHYQALCDGGEHSAENLRPVCTTCHQPKSAFEHKRNSKSKRLAKAREEHQAVTARVMKREPSRIRSRGFDKTKTRKFNGKTVEREVT